MMRQRGAAADHLHQPRRFAFDVRRRAPDRRDRRRQGLERPTRISVSSMSAIAASFVEVHVLAGDRHKLVPLLRQRRGDLAQTDAGDVGGEALAQQGPIAGSDDRRTSRPPTTRRASRYAEGALEHMPAHDPAAFVEERGRRQRAQVWIEFAVVRRRQRAAHRQHERRAVDDPPCPVEAVAIDRPGARRGCVFESCASSSTTSCGRQRRSWSRCVTSMVELAANVVSTSAGMRSTPCRNTKGL